MEKANPSQHTATATELAVGRCSLRPKLGAQAAIFVDEAGFYIASETLKCGRFSILLNAAHCLFVGFRVAHETKCTGLG